MKIHHIGYLVKDMSAAVMRFRQLGYIVEQEVRYDDLRKMEICFLSNENVQVELVHPDEDCTCVGKGLRKLGNAPYHICYETEDLKKTIAELTQYAWLMVKNPAPAPCIGNQKVDFFYHDEVGLI